MTKASTKPPAFLRIPGKTVEVGLAPVEWLIMSCVWERRSANALEVSEQLRRKDRRTFSPKTTGILLARLVSKGYVSPESGQFVAGVGGC